MASGKPTSSPVQIRRRLLLLLAGIQAVGWARAQPALPGAVEESRPRDAADVRRFGAKGDGVADDTAAIQSAFDLFGSGNGGNVYFPAGTYKSTRAILVPGRVSFYGDGISTIIKPATDGFVVGENSALTGTRIRDLCLVGSSATQNTGISIVPGNSPSKWLQGLRVSNVLIDLFGVGINAKNLRHAVFDQVVINRAAKGLRFEGQCVSNSVQSCKITRGGGAYGDGSIGIEIIASNDYEDKAVRRPEAIRIQNETLVYGYDTNIHVGECLSCVIKECDIDAALQYGIRAASTTGGFVVRDNYIAGLHRPGSVVKAFWMDDPGMPLNTPVLIDGNQFQFYGKPVPDSVALFVGKNRSGIVSIRNNMLGGGNAAAVALRLESKNVTVEDNFIYGVMASLVTAVGSNGHQFSRNNFTGPIVRDAGSAGKDRFEDNRGPQTTCYHGPVTLNAGVTSQNIPLAALGIKTNPVVGPDAFLLMRTTAYQIAGRSSRGNVRARFMAPDTVVVEVDNPVATASRDVWLDMEAS